MISSRIAASLPQIAERVSVVGLFLCAFFAWLGTAGFSVGIVLALAGLALSSAPWRAMARTAVFWICVVFAIYLAARGWFATLEFPETSALQWKRAGAWMKLIAFFPLAWPMMRDRRNVHRSAFVCLVGLLAGTLIAGWQFQPYLWVDGYRFGGYVGKSIAFAFYCSVGLLGLLVWGPRMIGAQARRGALMGGLTAAFVVIASVLLAAGVTASQSRGPVLALVAVMPLTLLWRYWYSLRAGLRKPRFVFAGALAAVVLAILVTLTAGPLVERVVRELPTIGTAVTQGIDFTGEDDVGYRLHMWRFGLERFADRPLFGWGPGSTERVLSEDDNPLLRHPTGKPWDHLHSLYVQGLFTHGATGLALTLLLLGALLTGLGKSYRAGHLARDDLIFFISNLALISVYSLTDFRHLNWDWRAYWLLLAAMMYARAAQPYGLAPASPVPSTAAGGNTGGAA